MKLLFPVEKSIVLNTDDFFAESQQKDGTHFEVSCRYGSHSVGAWWDEHWLDNERQVFRSPEEEDRHLHCADEIEATILLQQLQLEYSGVPL